MEARGTRIRHMTAVFTEVESVRPSWLWSDAVEPVLVYGWAYHRRAQVTAVSADLAGTSLPSVAQDIYRTDVFDRFRDTPNRSANARYSGFVLAGLVGPLAEPSVTGTIVAELETGDRRQATSFEIPVRGTPHRRVDLPGSPTVAIVMATHDPPSALFEAQVQSIKDQSLSTWGCIVCDDGSTQSSRAEIRRIIGDDPRFVVIENDERLGFYRNFERALGLVPQDVPFVALADHDDRWHADKLARLAEHLERNENVTLVASDARLIDTHGAVISDSFYEHRMPTHDDPYSLFLVNSLIGASMMFRRTILDVALPFPRAFDDVYHDHWLARVASGMGSIGFIADPIYDYVQHGRNVLGSQQAVRPWPVRMLLRSGVRWLLRVDDPQSREAWGDNFFTHVLEPRLAAELLLARWPAARERPWLDRIVAKASYRDVVRVFLDQVRETGASRLRRENVDVALFSGQLWSLEHLPATDHTTRAGSVT
jgi:glycosyltransferase involved in cell wall biosynthesis